MREWVFGLPWTHWLLYGTALWVGVGVLGTTFSAARGERARVRQGLRSIVAVVVVYTVVLLGVSLRQPPRQIPRGQSRCFEAVCFSVTGVEELPGFQARGQDRARLVRVSLEIQNVRQPGGHGEATARETALTAYLVDTAGHRWSTVPGLGGVSLGSSVEPGRPVTSDPVFRVGREATGLELVLVHRGWYAGRLVIGDAESLLHRRSGLLLDRGRGRTE